jgi:predicted nucleic acid-binding protein
MIVVDTNVLVYLHIHGEQTGQALRLLQADPFWLAPPLWRSEFRNVVAGLIRRQVSTLEQGQAIVAAALATMAGREVQPGSAKVLELAAASGCSAYDCEFVALAQELGIKLVTSDQQVIESFPGLVLPLAGS